jgi:hypothetical protein
LSALFALLPQRGSALTIEYLFEGALIETYYPVLPLEVGDTFRLVMRFEDAPNLCGTQVPDLCPPPINGIGVRGLFEGTGSVRIGAFERTDLAVQGFTYDDYDDLGMRDRFATSAPWLDDAGTAIARVGIILGTDPGFPPGVEGPLASEELPAHLALEEWSLAILNFVNDGTGDAIGQITHMEARVVPEPGVAALAAPVLVALSARARARAGRRSARR